MKREEIPPFGVLNQHECWCCLPLKLPPIPTTDSSNIVNASFYHLEIPQYRYVVVSQLSPLLGLSHVVNVSFYHLEGKQ
jgi:hypothetical protein